MVGEIISHYRITEHLGGGGMGVVYKALDERLNRYVALKFLPPELTKDHEANVRFRQEAQAASALDHPNIGTIHEIDETPDHRLFLALAFYDGGTLKKRIEGGPLSVTTVLDITIQIAQGLSRAHQSNIVHRDIKPANVMLTSEGLVKIVDFGLAKLASGPDVTRTGSTLGTIAYMSPEQARGGAVDAATDTWALGVVLYEMLAGQRPFIGTDDVAVLSSILEAAPAPIGELRKDVPVDVQRVVARALAKNRTARYATATEMLADLTACRDALNAPPTRADLSRALRRPVVAVPVAAALVVAVIVGAIGVRNSRRVQWAREEAIPQILRFVEADDYAAAFALAEEAERLLPGDPVLAGLWPQFSATGSLTTNPDGADVYVQPYDASEGAWTHLGSTPLEGLRLPRGVFRFRVEKEGFETRLLATRNPGVLLGTAGGGPGNPPSRIEVTLVPTDAADGMVPVPGGAFPVGLTGFNSDDPVNTASFLIDRHEVTNQAFKAFVDGGGYTDARHWSDLPVGADGSGAWEAAARAFVDSTEKPGPSTWELGSFAAGHGDWPVSGVSWYEAAAYCRSVDKTLPTLFDWARAGLSPAEIGSALAPAIVPLSNFAGKGAAAVGSYRGLGPYGTFDMAGNAREWVWNEAADGRRWSLGGAWSDPTYMFTVPNSLPPADRSPVNGFRCARYAAPPDATLIARVDTYGRDHRTAPAVSDEIYNVYRRQYPHGRWPLAERVEARDESAADWVRETITFDAGFETARENAALLSPNPASPPYQVVVFFPGIGPFVGRGSSTNLQPGLEDFIVRDGRALVYPVYKGAFERWDPLISLQGDAYLNAFRTRMGEWRQDVARVLDVLAARSDIDATRIAFRGASFGASTAFPLVALEERFKVAVLGPAGFTYREMPDEADALNYVSRVTIPVLMMGGRHDYIFPLETAQKPMFDRLATPAEHKRHVVFDTGHFPFPRGEMIREILAWLDRYLGPVKSN
jgi:formylglycine-generating enzyme required for sulfatase activity